MIPTPWHPGEDDPQEIGSAQPTWRRFRCTGCGGDVLTAEAARVVCGLCEQAAKAANSEQPVKPAA